MKKTNAKAPALKHILEGIQEAHRRMIEEKRRKGEQIAIMQDGKLVLINP